MRSLEAKRRAGRNHFLRNKNKPEYKARRAAYLKKWRTVNPDFFARTSYRHALLKAKCKHRKIPMYLTLDEYRALIEGKNCTYCGCPVGKTGSGLDRQDNTLGYTPTNAVPCCYRCNVMKADLTVDEFYEQCERIVDRHGPNQPRSEQR